MRRPTTGGRDAVGALAHLHRKMMRICVHVSGKEAPQNTLNGEWHGIDTRETCANSQCLIIVWIPALRGELHLVQLCMEGENRHGGEHCEHEAAPTIAETLLQDVAPNEVVHRLQAEADRSAPPKFEPPRVLRIT